MKGSSVCDDCSRGRAAEWEEACSPAQRQVTLPMVCVGLAMFLAALAQTVVASIVPLIVADLGGFDRYTRPSSSYLVAATVAFRHVGSATAALQFSRSLGGMMGLAATGVVMLQSFRTGVDALVPDNVKSVLPEGLFDSVKEDPRALVDPAAAQVLKEAVAGPGSGNLPAADNLLYSLNLALTGALSNVFTVLWVAVALSLPVALLLRVRAGRDGDPPGKP